MPNFKSIEPPSSETDTEYDDALYSPVSDDEPPASYFTHGMGFFEALEAMPFLKSFKLPDNTESSAYLQDDLFENQTPTQARQKRSAPSHTAEPISPTSNKRLRSQPAISSEPAFPATAFFDALKPGTSSLVITDDESDFDCSQFLDLKNGLFM